MSNHPVQLMSSSFVDPSLQFHPFHADRLSICQSNYSELANSLSTNTTKEPSAERGSQESRRRHQGYASRSFTMYDYDRNNHDKYKEAKVAGSVQPSSIGDLLSQAETADSQKTTVTSITTTTIVHEEQVQFNHPFSQPEISKIVSLDSFEKKEIQEEEQVQVNNPVSQPEISKVVSLDSFDKKETQEEKQEEKKQETIEVIIKEEGVVRTSSSALFPYSTSKFNVKRGENQKSDLRVRRNLPEISVDSKVRFAAPVRVTLHSETEGVISLFQDSFATRSFSIERNYR